MLVRLPNLRGWWRQQLDGTTIPPENCCCLVRGELECPIDAHRIRWIQQHWEW